MIRYGTDEIVVEEHHANDSQTHLGLGSFIDSSISIIIHYLVAAQHSNSTARHKQTQASHPWLQRSSSIAGQGRDKLFLSLSVCTVTLNIIGQESAALNNPHKSKKDG